MGEKEKVAALAGNEETAKLRRAKELIESQANDEESLLKSGEFIDDPGIQAVSQSETDEEARSRERESK